MFPGACEQSGGYRDLMISIFFEGQSGLRIIGEIQVLLVLWIPKFHMAVKKVRWGFQSCIVALLL